MSEPIQIHSDGGVQAQILVTVTDIKTDVAVMKEQLKAVPDHETRLRQLETLAASVQGGRDTWARIIGGVGLAGGVVSAVANFIHH